MMVHLLLHNTDLLGDLAREGRILGSRVVGQHRYRGFQSVRQVADVGARPFDDLLIVLKKRVDFVNQRVDFRRKRSGQPIGPAAADSRQSRN